ncbi:MAG: response regulator [Patescibacteria group bacterium]
MTEKKYTIAVVEDDTMLRKYLASSLSKEKNITVVTGANGEEGEKVIKETIPDLVLLDIIMPKKNGFEVLEAIKKDPKTKDIRVIVLSNLGQQSDIDQAKKLGAIDYFVKVDLEMSAIVSKVKAILEE